MLHWYLCVVNVVTVSDEVMPRGYKTVFMLNSAEHKILTANKN